MQVRCELVHFWFIQYNTDITSCYQAGLHNLIRDHLEEGSKRVAYFNETHGRPGASGLTIA